MKFIIMIAWFVLAMAGIIFLMSLTGSWVGAAVGFVFASLILWQLKGLD